MTDNPSDLPARPAAGPAEWTKGQAYYQHPGYGYVDHQLGPLMEVIRLAAEPLWGSPADALLAIDAVRVAMVHLRDEIKGLADEDAAIARRGGAE